MTDASQPEAADLADEDQRRFRALQAHFEACADLDTAGQRAYVERLARAEPGVAGELSDLLEPTSHTDVLADAFASARLETIDGLHLGPGVEVGPYTLERELGRGGMGQVFVARRSDPDRTVALKVLRGSRKDPTFIRRFEFESQVLARLNHPHIAHVYETGSERIGEVQALWYAMELVEGARSLDRRLAASKLSQGKKLELFLELCAAVQYAHQRGVVHRDLKPANILVDRDDNIKLIDFGIAKPLDAFESPEVNLTRAGEIIGTLAYMSPEQARGTGEPTDVRSDVYALGVIAYELLTGSLPLELRDKSLLDCVQTICTSPVRSEPLDETRQPTDVRIILRKALAKDPEDRYSTVDGFAADLRRYMRSEPIAARPPSVVYQAMKFAARNRVLVGAAAVALLALLAGGVLSTVGLLRARSAQADAEAARDHAQRAQTRAERAELAANQAADFAVEMLLSADPYEGASSEATMLEAVDAAAKRLDARDDFERPTEHRLRVTLAQLYLHLERAPEALAQARRALVTSDDEPQRLAARTLELEALLEGHLDDAITAPAQANFRAHRDAYGPEDPKTLEAEAVYIGALADEGQLELARAKMADLLERQIAVHGEDVDAVLQSRFRLAEWHYVAGDLTEAHRAFAQLRDDAARINGPDHPSTLGIRLRLAQATQASGDGASAAAMLERLRPDVERVLGETHEMTLGLLNSQANLAANDDETVARAPALYAELLDRLSDDDPSRRTVANNLAFALVRLERYDEAEVIFEKSWAEQREGAPRAQGSYLKTAANYATLFERTGRTKRAIALLAEAESKGREDFGEHYWIVEVIAARRAVLEGETPPVPTTERARKHLRGMSPAWAARLEAMPAPIAGD